ncbi:hypothetical protein BGZ68_008629 [Mortierella alpina]|nr:hypothetical protein BGZ68_008629 [Mortierella alpina]
MLTKSIFLALTTALALLVAGPTSVASLPVGGGDETLIAPEALNVPTITTRNPIFYHKIPSTIRSPYRYTYGNSLDRYDDEESSDDTSDMESDLPPPSPSRRPREDAYDEGLHEGPTLTDDPYVPQDHPPGSTPTSFPGAAGSRDSRAQRSFAVPEQISTPPALEDVEYELPVDEEQEISVEATWPSKFDSEEMWSIRFSRPRPSQKSSCDAEERSGPTIGIDLRENEFSVGFVDADGKAVLIPNEEGKLYTRADVRIIDGGLRAIVGTSAWGSGMDTSPDFFIRGTREPRNQVDLSKLRDAHTYKNFPEAVRFQLNGQAPTHVNFDDPATMNTPLEQEDLERLGLLNVEGDILAVVIQRAVDMAEAYLEQKVEGAVVTFPKKVLKYGAIGDSFLRDTVFDSSREKAIKQAGSKVQKLKSHDSYSEILALMMGHISFFESRLQRKPRGSEVYWDSNYLSQMVLLYNLRDSSEDLVVMRYTKGTFGRRSLHLDFVAGYLPNDGKIQAQFSQYMTAHVLDRFNRGIGAGGKDRSHKDTIDPEFLLIHDTQAGEWDYFSKSSKAKHHWESRLPITKDSYVKLTLKDYQECKKQFLKKRLSATVEQVLADAGIEDWGMIDHLIVADVSSFQAQSTAVLEDIVFGENSERKAVTVLDPQRAVAEGIIMIAGPTEAQNRCDTA